MNDYEYYHAKVKAQLSVIRDLIAEGYDGLTIDNVAHRLEKKAQFYKEKLDKLR